MSEPKKTTDSKSCETICTNSANSTIVAVINKAGSLLASLRPKQNHQKEKTTTLKAESHMEVIVGNKHDCEDKRISKEGRSALIFLGFTFGILGAIVGFATLAFIGGIMAGAGICAHCKNN